MGRKTKTYVILPFAFALLNVCTSQIATTEVEKQRESGECQKKLLECSSVDDKMSSSLLMDRSKITRVPLYPDRMFDRSTARQFSLQLHMRQLRSTVSSGKNQEYSDRLKS